MTLQIHLKFNSNESACHTDSFMQCEYEWCISSYYRAWQVYLWYNHSLIIEFFQLDQLRCLLTIGRIFFISLSKDASTIWQDNPRRIINTDDVMATVFMLSIFNSIGDDVRSGSIVHMMRLLVLIKVYAVNHLLRRGGE